jgi:hypothetical protein
MTPSSFLPPAPPPIRAEPPAELLLQALHGLLPTGLLDLLLDRIEAIR